MISRQDIRNQVRQILKEKVQVNRFGARTAALDITDLPAAIVYFPRERVLEMRDDYSTRELELRIEIAITPKSDPEEEIYGFSDHLELALLSDQALEGITRSLELESLDFTVDGEGDTVISAVQHTYKITYLAPRRIEVEFPLPREVYENGIRVV